MTKNQPFLSGFPTRLCGSIRRRLQDVIAAKRRDLADSSIATYAMQFSHVLPAEFLHGISVSKRIRQRTKTKERKNAERKNACPFEKKAGHFPSC